MQKSIDEMQLHQQMGVKTMERVKKTVPGRIPRMIFIIIMIAAILFSVLSTMLFQGSAVLSTLFFHPITDNTFMDFSYSVYFAAHAEPYQFVQLGAIYPPLCYMVLRPIAKMLNSEIKVEGLDFLQLRNTQLCLLAIVICTAVLLILTYQLIQQSVKGSSAEKTLLALLLTFSAPVLYSIERGNILLLALPATLFFVLYYDHPNRVFRELALIALALAFGLKQYPAIFGVLLLRDRKYWMAIRCAAYGVASMLIPAFYYDGIATLQQYAASIKNGCAVTVSSIGRLDLPSIVNNAFLLFTGSISRISLQGASMMRWASLIVLVACALILPKRWKQALCAGLIVMFFTNFSFYYSATFLLPAAMLLLMQDDYTAEDVVYCVVLASSLMVLLYNPSAIPVLAKYSMKLSEVTMSAASVLLTVMLLIDTCKQLYTNTRQKARSCIDAASEAIEPT